MRRVRAPDASEVRSKMSAWPWSRVAVVPWGAERMSSHEVMAPESAAGAGALSPLSLAEALSAAV